MVPHVSGFLEWMRWSTMNCNLGIILIGQSLSAPDLSDNQRHQHFVPFFTKPPAKSFKPPANLSSFTGTTRSKITTKLHTSPNQKDYLNLPIQLFFAAFGTDLPKDQATKTKKEITPKQPTSLNTTFERCCSIMK